MYIYLMYKKLKKVELIKICRYIFTLTILGMNFIKGIIVKENNINNSHKVI